MTPRRRRDRSRRRVGREAARASAITQQALLNLAAQLADVQAAGPTGLVDGGDPDGDTPASATFRKWCWRTMDPSRANTLWHELADWVGWLRSRCPLAHTIPGCWWQHPELVKELTARLLGLAFERARTSSVAVMTTSTNSQTWIITGTSKGFGRALARAALAAGDRVVAAVRTPASAAELEADYPDRCVVVRFDATDNGRAGELVRAAVDRFGRVDVLVNNAGRALIGAAQEVTDQQLRESMELQLFGPAALVRAVLPAMREQGSGTIVQMSSQGGRLTFPGASTYSASKFALEGWSEALAGEVAGFGIRVMLVEPSRFRTAFNAADVLEFSHASDTYREVLAQVREDMAGADGIQEGDPYRSAEIIVRLVHSPELPLRLPLGREAVQRLTDAYQRGLDEVCRLASVASSADFSDVAESDRRI